jgi:hypothetical protein
VAGSMTSIAALLTSVGTHPIANSDGRTLGSETLATAIMSDLYDPSDWADLNDLFARVKKGDASTAFESSDYYNDRYSDGGYFDNLEVASLAINCLESGSDDNRADMRKDAASLEKAAPVLGLYQAYGDILCAQWPYGPTDFPAEVHAPGAAPILVVGTTGDPATPYAEAKQLAKQLDSGHLVTYRGEGHTAYDKGISCIDHTVDAYFVDGVVPNTDPLCR